MGKTALVYLSMILLLLICITNGEDGERSLNEFTHYDEMMKMFRLKHIDVNYSKMVVMMGIQDLDNNQHQDQQRKKNQPASHNYQR